MPSVYVRDGHTNVDLTGTNLIEVQIVIAIHNTPVYDDSSQYKMAYVKYGDEAYLYPIDVLRNTWHVTWNNGWEARWISDDPSQPDTATCFSRFTLADKFHHMRPIYLGTNYSVEIMRQYYPFPTVSRNELPAEVPRPNQMEYQSGLYAMLQNQPFPFPYERPLVTAPACVALRKTYDYSIPLFSTLVEIVVAHVTSWFLTLWYYAKLLYYNVFNILYLTGVIQHLIVYTFAYVHYRDYYVPLLIVLVFTILSKTLAHAWSIPIPMEPNQELLNKLVFIHVPAPDLHLE